VTGIRPTRLPGRQVEVLVVHVDVVRIVWAAFARRHLVLADIRIVRRRAILA
jgi:hypothetical protein